MVPDIERKWIQGEMRGATPPARNSCLLLLILLLAVVFWRCCG